MYQNLKKDTGRRGIKPKKSLFSSPPTDKKLEKKQLNRKRKFKKIFQQIIFTSRPYSEDFHLLTVFLYIFSGCAKGLQNHGSIVKSYRQKCSLFSFR